MIELFPKVQYTKKEYIERKYKVLDIESSISSIGICQ
jgi:hypothetical protein